MTALPWGRALTPEDLDRIPFRGANIELFDGCLVVTRDDRAFDREDLDTMPEDGHRYELIEGAIVVTPAPSPRHQKISARLHMLLLATCPDHLDVLAAPLDVSLAHTIAQPDLLVARQQDFTDRGLPTAPLLAIEILSPRTRWLDLGEKREVYRRAGCPSYWVIDPDDGAFTAWELRSDEYVEVADIEPGQQWEATSPFPVTVAPAGLLP